MALHSGARSNTTSDLETALRDAMIGYQAGDPAAFERLHDLLAPLTRRYLLRLAGDAARTDDLVQDTFLQIHRARHTYDPAFPFRPWAYSIARHVFLMDARYRRTRADLVHPVVGQGPAGPGHEEAVVARHSLRRALERLSPGTRQSVLLHHLHGLSFHEIARRLRIADPAARARASRGVAHLRALLQDDE